MASNIWLAAGEGSLDAVKGFLDSGISPNALDDNSYSPLHAAASWGHADILRLLVERGGNINLADGDGDTPLYVVEQIGMAKLVVELGGDPKHVNEEGMTPAAALQEEFPHIALYLRTLTHEAGPSSASSSAAPQPQPDLDAPTDELMSAVRAIMERSERGELSERETDDQLREVVERIVGGQVEAGRAIGERMVEDEEGQEGGGQVRTRTADVLEDAQGAGKRKRDGDTIGR
ncbi:hypothetical protein JCM6882_000524 [Rhodosporidiobolus microsporus]